MRCIFGLILKFVIDGSNLLIKEWKAWVENRTNAICALTVIDLWRFVPRDCNPSDIGTRKKILLNWEVMYCFGMGLPFCC